MGDQSKEALQGLDLLGIEPAVEERGEIDVVGVVVEVGVGADPEDERRGLAQALRRRPQLGEHWGIMARFSGSGLLDLVLSSAAAKRLRRKDHHSSGFAEG